MATGTFPSLAAGIEPDPASTATMPRAALGNGWRQGVPWPWILVLALTGGGSLAVGDLLGGTDGTEALAKVAALEARLDDQEKLLEQRRMELEARLDEAEAGIETMARMQRDQNRAMSWLVAYTTKLGAAIGTIAKADGVEVDVSTPQMLPDVVDPVVP
jgi:hypothetical protein